MRKKEVKILEKKLGREAAFGQAWVNDNKIEIDPRLKGKLRMKTLIHELLHLSFPNISETEVLAAEKIIGNTLWKEGYRRVDLKHK